MGKKEEITDLFGSHVYEARDTEGKYVFYKGRLLKFNYEGSPIAIVVTRVDRKNKRMWGEHTELGEQQTVLSHHGHLVDATQTPPFCTDCEVPVTEESTEDGDVKAADRRDRTLADGTEIPE